VEEKIFNAIKGKNMKNEKNMNRRKFLKMSAVGAGTACAAAFLLKSDKPFNTTDGKVPQDAKKAFAKCGACSHTFFLLLNYEFGYPKKIEELASDPLAGGLMMTQNQCGMLWGATLAAGAESFRRFNNHNQAVFMSITASRHIVESFSIRTKGVNCKDIIDCDTNNQVEIVNFMLKSLPGGFNNMLCMNLAEKWFPEAVQAANKGLIAKQSDFSQPCINCASEVAKKMGGSEEEMVTVAGFAGGIGLSGHGCGALGAAIWMSSLKWCRENPGKSGYANPKSKEILKAFNENTGSEIVCSKLSGQSFNTIDEHTEFIKNGGCQNLITVLSQV